MNETIEQLQKEISRLEKVTYQAESSETIDKLATALSKFQGAVTTIKKDKTVNIPTKSGFKITYNYSDLATVMSTIRKPLSENGLAVTHSVQYLASGHRQLVTKLLHSSGQWLRSTLVIEPTQDEKTLGAKITYYRRYAVTSILGIVSDDDVDADLQGAMQQEEKVKKPAAPNAVALSEQAASLVGMNKNTPHFKEFIDHLVKVTKKCKNEILNEAAQKTETFFPALEKFQYQLMKG